MSVSATAPLLIKYLSILFAIWLALWVITLPLVPRETYSLGYFACGLAPLIGWFAIKPSRVRWFARMLFGLDGLDRENR